MPIILAHLVIVIYLKLPLMYLIRLIIFFNVYLCHINVMITIIDMLNILQDIIIN